MRCHSLPKPHAVWRAFWRKTCVPPFKPSTSLTITHITMIPYTSLSYTQHCLTTHNAFVTGWFLLWIIIICCVTVVPCMGMCVSSMMECHLWFPVTLALLLCPCNFLRVLHITTALFSLKLRNLMSMSLQHLSECAGRVGIRRMNLRSKTLCVAALQSHIFTTRRELLNPQSVVNGKSASSKSLLSSFYSCRSRIKTAQALLSHTCVPPRWVLYITNSSEQTEACTSWKKGKCSDCSSTAFSSAWK